MFPIVIAGLAFLFIMCASQFGIVIEQFRPRNGVVMAFMFINIVVGALCIVLLKAYLKKQAA